MSDYDESVSIYAAELKVSERQVRRYCQKRLIPSAQVTVGRTGRPKWIIKNTSPAAIEALRWHLEFQHFEPPTFCEPVEVQHYRKGPNGKLILAETTIEWRSSYSAPIRDPYSLIVTLAQRAALSQHGLTERDVINPPLCQNDRGLFITYPPHEEKIRALEQTEFELLYGLTKPKTSWEYRRAHRLLTKDIRQNDIMRAAEHLAIFHQTYGIDITHVSLARVLGLSKSSLYRTYRALVGKALKLALKRALSPTLDDQRRKERNQHPGLKCETHKQATVNGQPSSRRDANSGHNDDERENWGLHGHGLLCRKIPSDLPFEDLLGTVQELNAAGKPVNERNIYLTLRKKGVIAEGEILSDYFDATNVANAVRAVSK